MGTVSIKKMLCILFSVILIIGLIPTTQYAYAQPASDDETTAVGIASEGDTTDGENATASENSAEETSDNSSGEAEDNEQAQATNVEDEGSSEGTIQSQSTDEATDDTSGQEIQALAYTLPDDASGKVVLNLSNGNGEYSFSDYVDGRQGGDGSLLRYTVPEEESDLSPYADENGNITVHLPSDGDLDNTFTVVDAVGTEGDADYQVPIEVALGKEQAYDYKLIGWVNVATGDYYDVSGGATTADINLADENVFYADWVAASYDHGSSSDANLRETVSTKDFVTMHMYDYNEIFNLYSASLEQNGTTSEAWSDSRSLYDELMGAQSDIDATQLTNSFAFDNTGTAVESAGMLENLTSRTTGNRWSGTNGWPRDAKECWGIDSPTSHPLDLLFNPSSSYHGVNYVGDADYLFWIDDDGYYTYNSKEAAASYNQSDGRFYVYDGTQKVTGNTHTCFLPYNEYGADLSKYDGSVNYWFGMDMSVNFYLPAAVGSGGNLVDDKDMVFNFSGDDDILIFIDDKLVLDMSGIHDESFGSIDFTEGTVTMGTSTDDDGNITDGKTTDFSLSSGNHTLQVYYMERGAGASNLEVQFNVVPLWDYETGEVQTVTAEKVWQDSLGNTLDPNDLKGDYAKSVDVGLFDVLGAATDDTFGYTQDGTKYTVEYADDKEVTHTYVYDSSGPSLTYTENGTSVVYSDTNSSGQVIDDDGYVIAWLDGDTLHFRIDQQTLSGDNDWYYAWELLDPTGDYEVRELSESTSYTSEVSKENITSYTYWSVIGDKEIEENLSDSDFAIVLTDAAQQADGTIGDTKEAKGWVIVGTANGIETKEVTFSQIATLTSTEQNGTKSYYGTYGVTSQSEIDALGSGALWYLEDSGHADDDSSGGTVEGFYVYCVIDGTTYYLTVDEANNALTTTTNADEKSEFYYDSLGELRVVRDGDDRVIISADGVVGLDHAEFEADTNDSRVYTFTETASSGFAATITNTVNADLTIEKEISGSTDTSEYEFEVTLEENGSPYSGDVAVTYKDGTTDTLSFENGVANITITADNPATLTIESGMNWEVTEVTEGADSTLIYVDGNVVQRPASADEPYAASGTIADSSQVKFVNSYREYFPIDEEIVDDQSDIFNRDKWVKSESVNEYNAIEIEMTTTLPVVSGYDVENGNFTMDFHNVLDSELVLDETDADFSVYIDGNKIDHKYYTVTISPDDGCSFHVDVDLTALYKDGVITEDDLQGNTEISVFFFADLEGTGLNGTYTSTIWYDIYDGDELLYTSNEDVVEVYTYEIDILKYDASELNGTDYEGAALEGATLGVYYDEDCTNPVSRDGKPYTVTSDKFGSAIFYGLAEGTYYIQETKSPDGYILSDKVLKVSLADNLDDNTYSGLYANAPDGSTVPEPGPNPNATNPGGNGSHSGDQGATSDQGSGSAQTGDNTPFIALVVLAAVAAVIAAIAGRHAYRSRKSGSHLG